MRHMRMHKRRVAYVVCATPFLNVHTTLWSTYRFSSVMKMYFFFMSLFTHLSQQWTQHHGVWWCPCSVKITETNTHTRTLMYICTSNIYRLSYLSYLSHVCACVFMCLFLCICICTSIFTINKTGVVQVFDWLSSVVHSLSMTVYSFICLVILNICRLLILKTQTQ